MTGTNDIHGAFPVWRTLAVFVRDELSAMARRAWHWLACAWMQCDEAQP